MQTFFATSDPSAKALWEQGARMEMENDSVHGPYSSEKGDLPIEINREMEGKKGYKITTTLLYDLDDTKRYTSTETIEGKEQKLNAKDFSVELEDYDIPVSVGSRMTNQRVDFQISDKAETLLKKGGSRRLDRDFFEAMTGASTTSATIAGGDFTKVVMPNATLDALSTNLLKVGALTTADTLNANQIGKAVAFANCGGYVLTTGKRAQPKFSKVKGAGSEGYICFIHPFTKEAMMSDDDIKQLLRDAGNRGGKNELFTNALFELKGVIFVESDLVPIRLVGGSGGNVPYALNFMVGAQAYFHAWGQELKVRQYTTDAGRFLNYSLNYMAGWGKTKYNALDFSCIGLPCAVPNCASGVSTS